ncbi:MAG TPA: alpha/beta fold hydrolase, partial [Verrucomicrobiae bacterium]
MRRWLCLIMCALMAMVTRPVSAGVETEQVILLHGLCRTSRSMEPMARALTQAGYQVRNIDYPSRTATVAQLAESVIGPVVAAGQHNGVTQIHFVTHSLGGILVRYYLAHHAITNLGRVVMLGPPNQGSEVVDMLRGWWLFKKLNGPAGNELGTDPGSIVNQLGSANFCVGIIAGNRSINWINSLLIPGCDDGKVSVEKTKLAGMTDWIELATSHPFIMRNSTAMAQTISFLRTGKFDHTLTAGQMRFSSA